MADQFLIDYIRARRSTGQRDEAIRASAAASGWASADLDDAFAEVGPTTFPVQSLPSAVEPSPEQWRIINSWSSGALVTYLYSGFMRLWLFLALEIISQGLGVGVYLLFVLLPSGSSLLAYIFGGIALGLFNLLFLMYRLATSKRRAWKSRYWESFDQFLAVQRKWDVAGRVILIVIFLPAILGIGITLLLSSINGGSKTAGVSTLGGPQTAAVSSPLSAKARDSSRSSDIFELGKVLADYREANPTYPVRTACTPVSQLSELQPIFNVKSSIDPDLVSSQGEAPADAAWPDYCYKTDGSGSSYIIWAKSESSLNAGINEATGNGRPPEAAIPPNSQLPPGYGPNAYFMQP